MFTSIKSALIGILIISFFLPFFPPQAQAAPTTEPYKAIVKIRTFSEDHDFDMSEIGYGSGIIISSSGLILTNSHVVTSKSEFDSSDLETTYLVCLPFNMVDEPECSYSAKLVAKNEKLDTALLQLEAIPGLSTQTVFPYLDLSQIDTTNINDSIKAIGYPEIGGSSVTITQGIISGKTEKYKKKWIKTDAVISFGSSGGAALNAANQVIGITSAGHSDLLGSLGYIINIVSVNDWIQANKTKTPKTSPLLNRLKAFAIKEAGVNQSNIFENPTPRFTITKPADWEFTLPGENQLYLTNPGDELGGDVYLFISKFPYLVDDNSIIQHLKRTSIENVDYTLFKIHENSAFKIGNTNGRKIRFTNSSGQNTMYAVPIRNYVIFIVPGYGEEDKDKSIVDTILKSVNVKKDTSAFKEEKTYTHTDPYFSFTVDKDWVILKKNQKDTPIVILNKKNKDIYITVDITRTDATTKPLNQDGLLKHYKELIDSINKIGGLIDLKMELTETHPHFKVNNNLTDTIKGLTTMRTKGDNKVIAYEFGYTKKLNDKYILNISLYTTNPDKKAFATSRAEFNRLLRNFSLKAPQKKK